MNLKAILIFSSLIIGPFASVGLTVFYRRALAWWYETEIMMTHDDAQFSSFLVVLLVGFAVFILVMYRFIEKRWIWAPGE